MGLITTLNKLLFQGNTTLKESIERKARTTLAFLYKKPFCSDPFENTPEETDRIDVTTANNAAEVAGGKLVSDTYKSLGVNGNLSAIEEAFKTKIKTINSMLNTTSYNPFLTGDLQSVKIEEIYGVKYVARNNKDKKILLGVFDAYDYIENICCEGKVTPEWFKSKVLELYNLLATAGILKVE
jgi:hypothetical protein